jgi:amino acid adenylation domain-containing protein
VEESVAAVTRVSPRDRFVEFPTEEIGQSIAERFEKQVCKYPRRIAVQTNHMQLTYNDLNKLANRLARVLLQQFPDDRPIAILMEHDAPTVVAIFAALKAAKIFIPLDPALPDARIGQILSDSGTHSIVTNDKCLHTALDLPGGSRRIVNVDHCDASINTNTDNLDLKISPDSIGYVLYTSGSTGKPKGVIRSHRNDLRNLRQLTNSFAIGDDDRMTLLGSYSTGQGMADIFCALLNGATLFPRNLNTEGFNGLADWLMQERITFYHSAATLFRYFVHNLSGHEIFPELRIVRLGGEAVSWKDVESYKKHFSNNCILANELSCSEAAIITQFLMNKSTEINVTVPVGYPVEDKEVLILDEQCKKLGPGEIGEIAVRSRFLSPGYWNRPDLTELVFTRDREFLADRIYRTGDLGRKSANGCIEHLGRKDTQVKIRGYRVECYEIELALLQNPGVAQAFVTHREDARSETYLVAYVVPDRGVKLKVTEMRAGLSAHVPEYMVPKAFVFLDTLPLTPTGKIDRRALPEPVVARPPLDVPYAAPRGPVEESVAQLCSQILGITVIGIHDNLFDLGGDSLAAMQIMARVMKTFRVDVPLKRFYESPTIAGLSDIIATSNGSTEASGDTASWLDLDLGHPPLSYSQERLWFMEQLEPATLAYNLCQAYRLEGPLNVKALEESLNVVVNRHEILRTSFDADEGQPCQIISPALHLALPIADLRTAPEAERNSTSLRLAHEEAQRPFDLTQSPLLRSLLVKLADEEHLLTLTIHQMVCDGWSTRILMSEFWTSYEALCRAESPSLPTLFAQYSDFTIWQRQLLNQEWLQPQIAFWQETLKGSLPVLALPTDYPRPAVESFRGSRVLFVLPESLTKSLNELARQEGVTLFMTLLAAFKTLLYRYSGQEDSIVGFPVANRHWGEAAGLIGFFVNTLVARTFISGQLTFRECLFRVRDMCHAAYANQDLPFEKLVEVLRPSRDLSRNPIVQAMFTFQNMPLTYSVPPLLSSTPISIDNGTSKVDLTLSLTERDSQLAGFFEYSTDLFNHDRIERMAGHFQTLLNGIVADPDQRISHLPILNDAERDQLLSEWNNTETYYPREKCLHELIEDQAERIPDAIAITFVRQQLTYRELNARANQLARYLQELGVGPEKLVGICAERSLDMVIGLLGILKAGGAYVPLDPSYPRERLGFMLRDAQVSVLITQAMLVEDRGWRPVLSPSTKLRIDSAEGMEDSEPQSSVFGPPMKIVCLDKDWEKIAQQSEGNLEKGATSQNLAYVFYTSGSTGNPKGVEVSHRSVVNCLHSMAQRLEFTDQDVLLAVTTISFDIAALELFLPVLVGGKVVVASHETAIDGTELLSRLTEYSATAMQATPSTWRLLLDAGWAGSKGFKILCGGEVLSRDLANQLLQCGTLWNLYGPTEATIWSTVFKVETGEGPVFIGRPISNTRIYVLDSHLQVVPIGIYGEIYIGGDGLAEGYLNRPELTAERFIRNPFSDDLDALLYRTGDRARYQPDGNIEFLGRVDNQVKVRGYRIELGEIEAVLNQHPAVKDCVIVARARDLSEEKELVGYIVPNQDSVVLASDLRFLLHQKLPEYMVPTSFVFLNALPLTPNGKVDRSQLPPPDDSRPALEQGVVEPRSEIEELVAQVWREVLKAERVGVYDNFFDLGGHSLLATRVVARLRSNFNVDLPLRKLFEFPTVAGLAKHIDFLRSNQQGVGAPPIMRIPRDGPLPLSFSQRRLWFLQKLDPNFTAYNIPAVFRIEGDLNVSVLEKALNEIVHRHEILRTRIIEVDGQPFQEVVPSVPIELSLVDLSHLPKDQATFEVEQLSAEDRRQPYNLAEAPLMRAKLLRLDEQEHIFILNFHHIVCDGSSLIIFYHELATLYEAFLDGKDFTLPVLPVQYADYAVWQQETIQGERLEAQLGFWKRQFGAALTTLNLPTDYERPAVQTYRGARLTKVVSEEVTKALKVLSRHQGVTLFMTLLTTLDIVLSRHSGHGDIIVGSTIAGRNRAEVERLIGFFINALALRTDLSGNPTFLELLKRVREVCLDAYTHQDLPFEKVVEEINPERDLGRNPLFQILFNMVDISERILELAGCQTVKLPTSAPEAKFDIILHAPEVDGKLELAIVYNADLFAESRISSLLEQLGDLLAQVVENPGLTVDQYSLVPLSAQRVLPDPTQSLDDTWEGAIHDLFSRQANRTPDCPAVVDSNEAWTYSELDKRSNQLAHCLIAGGIQSKDVVAIYAHRSCPLILALLGALKAGAAFVIIDPAYPAQRMIDYLKIAQPKGWLHMEAAGELPEELSVFLNSLGISCRAKFPGMKHEIGDCLSQFPEGETGVSVNADDPAYIAFTSGSTGQPKGVLCRHGPITHFLPWQEREFDLTSTDRFSLLSGLAYNHLHRDIFTALWLGATVYLPAPEILRSPDQLTEWLLANEITILHLTPASGRLLHTALGKTLSSIRDISFAGDVLTQRDVARICKIAPNANISNRYGATETQRAVSYYKVAKDLLSSETNLNRLVPLGRGAKDVQLLLLTSAKKMAGIGELGELYVRSPHLAAGYIGDEKLTQERFITNPFTNDPDDRLYRTGELGRYLPDGNVEWVGRNDRRVNIRGFRVELEEIESVLKRHPAVTEAAVIVREFDETNFVNPKSKIQNLKSDQRLVAYVVPELDQPLSIDALRSFLSARLPGYMVPSHFLVLGRIPLTPNGKVDYQALPPADQSLTGQRDSFVAPGNDLDAKLCKIFSAVLGIQHIGVNENFFRLGGHSLLAAQVATHIKETFGVALDLRMFLESPTVAALAKAIEVRRKDASTTPIKDETDREKLEL